MIIFFTIFTKPYWFIMNFPYDLKIICYIINLWIFYGFEYQRFYYGPWISGLISQIVFSLIFDMCF